MGPRVRSLLPALCVFALLARAAQAGVYGVPTNLNADGTTSGSSVNPPGWFAVDGTLNSFVGGEGVHQIRLFIEVTGSTLDVLVFDPGTGTSSNPGSRDLSNDTGTQTTFTLLDPAGVTLAALTVGNEPNLGPPDVLTGNNRLVRFTPPCGIGGATSCGFFRLNNLLSPNNVSFSGLSPGLYEFRVSTSGGSESNAFGVRFAVARDAVTGQPTGSYAAYTTANSDTSTGPPTPTETSWLVAALNRGSPPANIVQPMVMFPYVNRGCTIETSNFDADINNVSGAGASGDIVDVLGSGTGLTMSNGTAHAEDTISVESALFTNLESTNYGMYTLTNNTGSQQNAFDWRVGDFQGFTFPGGATRPGNPRDPIRIYLPEAYAPVSGNPNATAPAEPILAASARVVSGVNPPVVGSLTTYLITATVDNTTASPISGVQITVGVPSPVTFAGNEHCYIDNDTIADAFCTFTNSGAGTPFWRRVTLNTPLAAGSAFTLNFEVTLIPAALGLQSLTGAVAAGAPPPNTTVWAQYTPAFSSVAFPRSETLGPVCELRIDVGDGVIATRATLRGLRVDPAAGRVEFATSSQRETVAFNVYATDDASGWGPRRLLTRLPVRAPVRSSLLPIAYSVRTPPITARHVVIEEIDSRGRRHDLGPVSVGDAPLRRAFEAIEERLDAAGAPPGRAVRLVAGTQAGRLVGPRAETPLAAVTVSAPRGIKIEVGQAGSVQVPLVDLWAQGLPPATPVTRLRLTNRGRLVPIQVSSDTLSFQSEALSTDFTGTNVYILSWGTLPVAPKVPLTVSEEPRRPADVRVQQNTIYVADNPQDTDPWVWDLLLGDGTGWPYPADPTLGDFDLPDLQPGVTGTAPVRIRLLGRTQHRHTVEAWINGDRVGRLTFEGMAPGLLTGSVPAQTLLASGNQLTLTYSAWPTGPETGLAYLSHVDIGVPVITPTAPVTPDRLAPYDPKLPSFTGADYLIITHAQFRAQAEQIASLENAHGRRARIVDVERAYDAYSGGIVEAQAVRALVRQAALSRSMRYVLLVGGDTFDSHDYLGTGAVSFVPSLLAWDGHFGRVPSENRYADVNGDGKPELAIGRLPARSVGEAAALAAKIASQWTILRSAAQRHLFAVDNQGLTDVAFRAEAQTVARRLALGSVVSWADISQGLSAARTTLLNGLSQGSLTTSYFGHAGPESWADEALLTVDDVASLAGSPGRTVLFTWACEAQWYQNLTGPSVNEALLLLPDGGALATFGPAGATDPKRQRALFGRVYGPWLRRGFTLGEAIRRAKIAALNDPRNRVVVEGFNLLGDPALPGPSPGLR